VISRALSSGSYRPSHGLSASSLGTVLRLPSTVPSMETSSRKPENTTGDGDLFRFRFAMNFRVTHNRLVLFVTGVLVFVSLRLEKTALVSVISVLVSV